MFQMIYDRFNHIFIIIISTVDNKDAVTRLRKMIFYPGAKACQ
ncbi:hypothetical protein ES705_37154 [subsurface metagenome]